jgi:hypothetical protein
MFEETWEDDSPTMDVFAATDEALTIGAHFSPKIPPAFDGRTSWFAYEELVADWLDVTTLDPEKQAPALKVRLTGEAAIFKRMLDRDRLKDPSTGVDYFMNTLRPEFRKGPEAVFLFRFLQIFNLRRASGDMIKWIGRYVVSRKRLLDSWMDLMPQAAPAEANLEYQQEARLLNADPADPEVYNQWIQRNRTRHERTFPLQDPMFTYFFIVAADLNEQQRERFTSTMMLRNITVPQYTFDIVRTVFHDLFCAPRNSIENPHVRSTRVDGSKSFLILDQGELEGSYGYWAIDEDADEEGFL